MQEVDRKREGFGLHTDFSRSCIMNSSSTENESICEGRIGGCRMADGSSLLELLKEVDVAD